MVCQRGNALLCLRKLLLGLLLFAEQQAVKLDPFHPRQRILLVAGAFDQYRDAKPLKLLLDLRRMVDHRIFNGKTAVGGQDRLIIRGAVSPRIGDLSVFHRLARIPEIPPVSLCAGQCYAIQRPDADDRIHHGGRNQIDVFNRLLQNRQILLQPGRQGRVLRYHKIAFLADGDKAVPARALIDRKLLGIFQRVTARNRQPGSGRLRLLCSTARQQQGGQHQKCYPLHSAAASVALSKVRV